MLKQHRLAMHLFPLFCCLDGLMVCEACFVVQRFIGALSTKWSKSYGEVMGELDCHLLSSKQQTYVCEGQR